MNCLHKKIIKCISDGIFVDFLRVSIFVTVKIYFRLSSPHCHTVRKETSLQKFCGQSITVYC